MKIVLSASLLLLSFGVFSQTNPTSDPTGVGFGAGTPGNTVSPPVTVPSPGAVPGSFGTSPPSTNPDVSSPPRGNTFPQQQMQNTTPDTTPSFPDSPQNTFPGASNPAGTGVAPGPIGSPSVGP